MDDLNVYATTAKRYPLLTPDQEVELARKVRAGCEVSKKKFFNHNIRLVLSVVTRKRHVYREVDWNDLVQEGMRGLLLAIDKFDPERGIKFSTYAYMWVLQAVTRYHANHRSSLRLPINTQAVIKKIRAYSFEFKKEHGIRPSIAQISEGLEIAECTIQLATQAVPKEKLFHLDLPLKAGESDSKNLGDVIEDKMNRPTATDTREIVEKLMAPLTNRERQVMSVYYGLDDGQSKSMKQTAEKIGISRERCRQIVVSSMRKIRARLPHSKYTPEDLLWEEVS